MSYLSRVFFLCAFLILAAHLAHADANHCTDFFEKTPRRESDDFPIERYYPSVSISVGPKGELNFSRSSKAYILWRQKTPPHIPDRAFAFHYMQPPEVVSHVVLSSSPAISEDLLARSVQTLSRALSEHLSAVNSTHAHSFDLSYLLVQYDQKFSFMVFPGPFQHHAVLSSLMKANEGLRVVDGGSLGISLKPESGSTSRSSAHVEYSRGMMWVIKSNFPWFVGPEIDKNEFESQLLQELLKVSSSPNSFSFEVSSSSQLHPEPAPDFGLSRSVRGFGGGGGFR